VSCAVCCSVLYSWALCKLMQCVLPYAAFVVSATCAVPACSLPWIHLALDQLLQSMLVRPMTKLSAKLLTVDTSSR
jgi:hypothetical protein